MGWSYGIVNGRKVGYAVRATCDKRGCKEKIDRGLAYVCGPMHGGGDGFCGRYFCYAHLVMAAEGQLCEECYAAIESVMA